MKFFVFLLILSSVTFAQGVYIDYDGICRNFHVTVNSEIEGCWDVKLDAPGEVQHPEGFRSSFYYVENALCSPDTEVTLRMLLESGEDTDVVAKLRQGDTILEEPFIIEQKCPKVLPENLSLVAISIIILVLLTGVIIYKKWPKKRTRRKKR